MKINKRRAGVIVGGVGSVAAIAALALGGTSALFSSEANDQANSIQAGTNVLTENTPLSTVVNSVGFMPGDSEVSRYALKYAGNDAFVGLDIKITSVAAAACDAVSASDADVTEAEMRLCTATGSQPMYNGDTSTQSGAFDLGVAPENGNTFSPVVLSSTLQGAATCASDAAKVITCISELKNIPLPPGYISAPIEEDLIWKDGKTNSVKVTSSLPLGAHNAFQGSTVKIDLVSHAVQSANNSVPKAQADPTTTFGYGAGQATMLFPKTWS
jgi:predicted ribosomally synthesized peptide with SipW-like signal peptide